MSVLLGTRQVAPITRGKTLLASLPGCTRTSASVYAPPPPRALRQIVYSTKKCQTKKTQTRSSSRKYLRMSNQSTSSMQAQLGRIHDKKNQRTVSHRHFTKNWAGWWPSSQRRDNARAAVGTYGIGFGRGKEHLFCLLFFDREEKLREVCGVAGKTCFSVDLWHEKKIRENFIWLTSVYTGFEEGISAYRTYNCAKNIKDLFVYENPIFFFTGTFIIVIGFFHYFLWVRAWVCCNNDAHILLMMRLCFFSLLSRV